MSDPAPNTLPPNPAPTPVPPVDVRGLSKAEYEAEKCRVLNRQRPWPKYGR